MTTPVLEVFFDFACPWSYLAFNRACEAAMRTLSVIEWRPVISGQVSSAVAPRSEAELAYQQKDLRDWARYCGVKINFAGAPDSAAALKGAFLAVEHGLEKAYIGNVFEACWGKELNIADVGVLSDIAVDSGLDKAEFGEWLDKQAVADALQRNGEEMLERGGFGTPVMFVGDDFYLGNERMPLVELALGQASDIEFVMPGSHDSGAPDEGDGELFSEEKTG